MVDTATETTFFRRHWAVLLLLWTLICAGLSALWPSSPGNTQQANMWLATEHARAIRPSLQEDERFSGVQLKAGTAMNGSLLVMGLVGDAEALADLRTMVRASDPPVSVWWCVEVTDLHASQTSRALPVHQQDWASPRSGTQVYLALGGRKS